MAYFPNPPVSFFLTIPMILTVADVSFLHDVTMPRWIKWYLWIMYFLSAHKAQTITTFSQNSKNDVVKYLKVKSDKVHVTPLAVSDSILRQKSKENNKKNYILAVPGTFISRKNVENTVFAFKHLPANLKNTYQLVVVGHTQGDGFNKLKDFVASEDMVEKVVFTGRVTDQELSNLYSWAKLFVCSSLYEGFGLTILEAMKCGTPVISYANSSLSEVIGKAGILVNNYTELSEAMYRVLSSQTLQNTLKHKGLKRATHYSWAKTATSFLASLPKNVN